MAQYPKLHQEDYDSKAASGPWYQLARRLSQIFHPILMNLIAFLIVGYTALSTPAYGLLWAGICILALLLPPTLFYYFRMRQGVYSDEDVSVREQRNELYLFGFVWVAIAAVGLGFLGVPRPFLALILCALGIGLIGGLVNLFWKISAHATAVACTATIALLYVPLLGLALWVCALAVGWARVRTRNHTPMQVLAGFGSAALVVLAAFSVMGLRG